MDLSLVSVGSLEASQRATSLHPAAAYLARLAYGSRRAMRQALVAVAAEFGMTVDAMPWHLLRRPHLEALRARLAERYAPATANRFLAAVRGVLTVARQATLLSADDFDLAVGVANVRGERLPAGRALTSGELRALFDACDASTPIGARDAALLGLLYGVGLRRAEAVALDIASVDLDAASIRVLGKGKKERVGHAPRGCIEALRRWLAYRGDEAGPLLYPVRRGGHVERRRLTDQAVLSAMAALATRAGVARFSPHDCRRTMIGDLLDLGVDLATVQKMVGHSSPQTTARYDRRPDQARRRAADLLHVPFSAPRGDPQRRTGAEEQDTNCR